MMKMQEFEAIREDCPDCGGVGTQSCAEYSGGWRYVHWDCPPCKGTGNRLGLMPHHSATGKLVRELRAYRA